MAEGDAERRRIGYRHLPTSPPVPRAATTARVDGREFRNRILTSLPRAELALIAPALVREEMNLRQVMRRPGERAVAVQFVESGMASLVLGLTDGGIFEVAAVGYEGVLGAELALDPAGRGGLVVETVGQVAGELWSLPRSRAIEILPRCPALLRSLVRFNALLFSVAAQTVACVQAHPINTRLARWLLTVADLTGAPSFALTQEFMAEMLGARRPTVSVAAHTLASAGLIEYRRGRIDIKDRDGLKEASCECYEALRRVYDQLED